MLETAGIIGLVCVVGVFVFDLREKQRASVAQAWQLLATPGAGNFGKSDALEFLNSEWGCLPEFVGVDWCWKRRISLAGIDVSDTRNGGEVILDRIDLSDADLRGADFSGASLTGAVLVNTNLGKANFTAVTAEGMQLRGARLKQADFSGAHLLYADLTGAKDLNVREFDGLHPTDFSLENAQKSFRKHAPDLSIDLTGANVSALTIDYKNYDPAGIIEVGIRRVVDLSDAWAWADDQPHAAFENLRVYDPGRNGVNRTKAQSELQALITRGLVPRYHPGKELFAEYSSVAATNGLVLPPPTIKVPED